MRITKGKVVLIVGGGTALRDRMAKVLKITGNVIRIKLLRGGIYNVPSEWLR